MPSCEEQQCKAPSLPLDGRHACALCECELHGICGSFYQDDSIKYQNICTLCHVAVARRNHNLRMDGKPPLRPPLTSQEVRLEGLIPEISKSASSHSYPDFWVALPRLSKFARTRYGSHASRPTYSSSTTRSPTGLQGHSNT